MNETQHGSIHATSIKCSPSLPDTLSSSRDSCRLEPTRARGGGESANGNSPAERIEVIRDAAGFDALRSEWDRLLGETRATVFQTWEWQAAWWRHLGRGRRWLWTLRRGDRLIALAPLVIRRHLGLPLREVVFAGTGASDYLDIIARPEDGDAACRALLYHLGSQRREWDMVDLQQLRGESPLLQAEAPDGLQARVLEQEPCPVASMPTDWETFTATLGKKLRSNIGYYERLMGRTFQFELGAASGDEIAEAMENLFRLHQRRWRRRGLPGALAGRRVQAFHRDVARQFDERGWLRLFTLRLDGRIQAVLYCFNYGGSGYYYLGGFEPELARYSPGTVLTAHAIREAIREGAQEFDFLRGDEPYKYVWNASDRWNRRFLMWQPALPSSWAPRLIDLEMRIEHRVKRWARSR